MDQNPNIYNFIVNNISDAVFVYQRVGDGVPTNFIDVNDAACKMLGYTKEELLKLSHNALSDDSFQDIVKYSDETNLLFESIMLTKDGRGIPVEISSHIFPHEGISTVVATARDIS